MKLTIKSIESEKQIQGKTGPLTIVKFIGEDEAGNLGTYDSFGTSVKEKLGQTVEGEVKENQYGRSFSLPRTAQGARSFGKSETERREIIAQNAMGHATAIMAAMIRAGDAKFADVSRLPGLAKRIYDATLTIASNPPSQVNLVEKTEVEIPKEDEIDISDINL